MANLLKGEKEVTPPKYPKISIIDTYHTQSNQCEDASLHKRVINMGGEPSLIKRVNCAKIPEE